MNLEIFRTRLKKLLSSRGMSLNDLSDHTGITAPTLSRYLTQDRYPHIDALYKICDYFKVSIDWMVGFDAEESYSSISEEEKELSELFTLSSESDKRAILAILEKYKVADND